MRTKGLRTPTPSTLQSPAGDSSPYEGELKGSKVAPCGAIKSAAKPQHFFGEYYKILTKFGGMGGGMSFIVSEL